MINPRKATSFDPETVQKLETILDEAWRSLSPERRQRTTKSHIAQRIIQHAAQGERDPVRLRACATLSSGHDDDQRS